MSTINDPIELVRFIETNKVYNSFESKAVEHIISTENAEPPNNKVENQNNDNFNKYNITHII